jgi:acyl carrier protein
MNIKSKVRSFVTENFYLSDPAALADEASLLDQGIIDSTGVLEVIGFLEDTFQISVEDDEMIPDNLDSIEKIAHFVAAKMSTPTVTDAAPASVMPVSSPAP